MTRDVDVERRRVLRWTAMTVASGLGVSCAATEAGRKPAELDAIGRGWPWLNSDPLGPDQLLGKVVLVDFWTYTCINWMRTLPYRRAWAHKYAEHLVLIGVHTPEFGFEANVDNVRRAVRQMQIDYPVVIDSNYVIWNTFKNHYWPALYVIDTHGVVRDHQFGEGEYATREMAIQRLLRETGNGRVPDGVVSVDPQGPEVAADVEHLKSGENYLGYIRTSGFSSPGGARVDRRLAYTVPSRLALNHWAHAGEWTVGQQATTLNTAGGRIAYRFHARDVNLAMGPSRPGTSVRFRSSIDGQPPNAAQGTDVAADGTGVVTDQRMYQLIRQTTPIVDRTFEIEFLDAGVEAYAFTFG